MTITPPGNFSQYYQQYLNQLTPQINVSAEPVEFPAVPGQPQKLGFLGRTIDILSRPLRVISNPVMKAVELPEKLDELQEREAAGEDVSVGEKLAPFGELAAAPFTGFFSDDPENKPYWSDIIEKSEDVYNRNNPNYVDVENNINPVAKGIAGFAGDVVLDPLTWIPGVAIAKGLGKAGDLGQKALGTVSTKVAKEGAEQATREGLETAAERVLRENPPKPASFDDVSATANPAQASDVIRQSIDETKPVKEALVSPLRQIINDAKIFPKGAKPLSRRNQIDQFLKKAQKPLVAPKIPIPKELLGRDTVLSYEEWLGQMDNLLNQGKLDDIPFPLDEINGVKLEEPTWQSFFEKADEIKAADPAGYQRWLETNSDVIEEAGLNAYNKYAQGFQANPNVNLLGDISEDAPIVSGAAAAIARIAAMEGVELENARFIFDTAGNRLFDALRQMDVENFSKFLDDAQYVLSRNGIVEAMSTSAVVKGSMQAKLLRSFDISIPQFRAAQQNMVDRLAAVVNSNPPAPVDEAVENLMDDEGFVELMRAVLQGTRGERGDIINFDNTDLLEDIVSALGSSSGMTIRTNFDEKFLKKEYSFILDNGVLKVLKTDVKKGQGKARVADTWSSYVQMTMFQNFSKGVSLLFRGVPERGANGKILKNDKGNPIYIEPPKYINKRNRQAYFGFELSRNLEAVIIPTLRAHNDYIAARGIPLTLDAYIGSERVVSPLRLEDVYEVLKQNIDNRDRLRLLLFNADTGMDTTLLGDAAIAVSRGAGVDEVTAILRRGTNRWNKEPNNNWLAKDTPVDESEWKYYFGHRLGEAKPQDGDGFRWVPNIDDKGRTVGHYAQWDPLRNAEILAEAFVRSRTTLDEVAEIRKQQYLARDITDFQTVAPMVAQNLLDMLRDPTRNAEAMLAIRNVGKMLKDFIKPIDVGEVGALYSAEALEAAIPQHVRNAVRDAEDLAKARAAGDTAEASRVRERAAKSDKKEADRTQQDAINAAEEIRANPGAYDQATRDAAETVLSYRDGMPEWNIASTIAMNTTRERFLNAMNGKWRMGVEDHLGAFLKFLAPNRQAQNWMKLVEGRLRTIKNNRTFDGQVAGTPILVQAMRNLQSGIKAADEANPIVREAQQALEREITPLFGTSNELIRTIADTSFGRTGATLDEIAKSLESHAVLGTTEKTRMAILPERGAWFDLDLAEKVAKEESIDIVSAALRQWETWGDIDDPIGFIAKVNAAVFNVATKAAFIDNFVLEMAPRGLLVRTAKEAKANGFVKLVADGKSAFGGYLPDDLYVDPEIAFIFSRMDEVFRTSRRLESPFGQWWTDTMDPFMLTWKYTVTVIRLGHHIRNEIGGQSMRWIALGNSGFARAERNAYKVMSKDNAYEGADILRGLTQMGEQAPAGGDTIIGGRLGNLTTDEAVSDFYNNLRAVGKRAEDIYDEGLEGPAKRAADVLGTVVTAGFGARGGRIEQAALGVSEFVENKARLAHYLQVLDQLGRTTATGKPRQFVRGIGNVVTPKTMAEARQIAIESALKYHPDPSLLTAFEARYMRRVFPFYNWYKQALVALLESAMINPARTLTTIPKASYNVAIAAGIDPYSLMDPFPEDQMFPSFLTADMTGPQFEIDGRYIAVNPGFANIDVFSDTFSDPVAGVVQMTNPIVRVPLELLAGSRFGTQAPIRDVSDFIDSSIPGVNYISNISGRSVTGGFEEQSRIASGDKTAFDQWLSAFNWAFGLGVRNYSRSSYINFAEIEARNEAANQ